jgi:hypothetical protein
MSRVIRSSSQVASQELIAKLVKAGYLQHALCHDPGAIATAIARLKEHLRGGDAKSPSTVTATTARSASHVSIGMGGESLSSKPLCPACGRLMGLTRTIAARAGYRELRTYGCRECGVWITEGSSSENCSPVEPDLLATDLSRERYVVEVDGIAKAEYPIFVKALKASLQLKRELPNCRVKLRDVISR